MAYYKIPPLDCQLEGDRIIWQEAGEVLWLEPYGTDAVRVRGSKSLRIDGELNWTLLEQSRSPLASVELGGSRAILRNGKITATITGDGTLCFTSSNTGKVLLEESWIDGRIHTAPLRRAREYETLAGDTFRISTYFKADPKEHLYGMGQEPNDCFDLKGSTTELAQKNTKCTIPFLYSTNGYGLLWNNPSVGRAEFTTNHTMWQANAARQLDYIIIAGDTPAEIMGTYTAFTGRAGRLPRWALGLWQSKLRYETQEEVLNVVREYHRRGIPLSVIVIDYFHWTQQGEWTFDRKAWPDPAAMVREIEAMGTKVMISIWPTVDPRSENYQEMRRKNYLIKAEKGVDVQFMFYGPETYYDATHPGARAYLWNKVQEGYGVYGIRQFWLDEAEPEMRPYSYDNVRFYLGNGMEVSNLYSFYHAKAFYDGAIRAGETDVVNLVRCAWHGSQRLGVVLWSGDVASTFESLRKQLKAGLNVSLCGIPWWTTDIGGFVNGDPDSETFRELMVRWFQFGTFCPIFRLHGYRLPYIGRELDDPDGKCYTGGPNEVWSFGERVGAILEKYIRVREKLIPYLEKHLEKASQTGIPVMRPLLFDFYWDPNTYQVDDEYLFGDDILVAPVVEQGAAERKVYLPKGACWTEVSTGKAYEGGRVITAQAPLDLIPLFFRDGSQMELYKV